MYLVRELDKFIIILIINTMKKECPNCHSNKIEDITMAPHQPENEKTQYHLIPRYRCNEEDCGWEGPLEE